MRQVQVPSAVCRRVVILALCFCVLYLTLTHSPDVRDISSTEAQEIYLQDVRHHIQSGELPSNLSSQSPHAGPASPPPAAPGGPTYVLLMAYQRTGSSFLGELFNHHPGAVYMFEPGDGIYASMYSTVQDWNTRDDITNQHDGTKREIPEIEIKTVVEKLNSIYKCNFHDLPAELLNHDFFHLFPEQMLALKDFIRCSNQIIETQNLKHNCYMVTRSKCPDRLGDNNTRSEQCRVMLQPDATYRSDEIKRYVLCNQRIKDGIHHCIRDASVMCSYKPIRVTKTVRVSMEMVEALLQVIPDLKVIHYLRDPRPVSFSRQIHPTLRGTHAEYGSRTDRLLRSAHLYCQDVHRDLLHRARLQRRYPEAFLEVYFEELAAHPHSTAAKIYEFLDLKLPVEVTQWLEDHTQSNGGDETTRNSRDVVYSWRSKINGTDLQNLNRRCAGLYKIISKPDLWPNTTVT